VSTRKASPCGLAAERYGKAGLYVFPCKPGKRPYVCWGTAATSDIEQVRQWWGHWPDAMIGMSCGPSGIVAIDIDVKDGKNGWEAIDERMLDWGQLPGTRTTRTPSGGSHMIYRHPGPEYDIRNDTSTKVGVGVDIRGDGGMVIMPPSRGDGGTYEQQVDTLTVVLPSGWARGLSTPKHVPVPVELRPSIGSGARYGTVVLRGEADAVAKAEPGQRNATLTRSVFKVGTIADRCGISGEQAEEMFRWAVSQWGDAGELRKSADTFVRAFEAGRQTPRDMELRSA
jgi:hypothetical protein